jgi:hypothetical protein
VIEPIQQAFLGELDRRGKTERRLLQPTEFGPAFLLFLLWTLLASVVLRVRTLAAPSRIGSIDALRLLGRA